MGCWEDAPTTIYCWMRVVNIAPVLGSSSEFQFPCTYDFDDSIKKKKCKHNLYIYFKNGTHLMYFGGGPKITIKQIQEKEYIPFIKQYRLDSESQFKLQMQKCELTKLIGKDKLRKFVF